MLKKNIKILNHGMMEDALIVYSEVEPWEVTLEADDNIKLSAISDDLFNALIDVRLKCSEYDINLLCNGARKDVFPSSMSKSMGGGLFAYKLTLGKQAKRSDVVNIFEPTNEHNLIATPDEQRAFYKEWLASL